jgi:hypothetical protein
VETSGDASRDWASSETCWLVSLFSLPVSIFMRMLPA